jgi:hypothetical protein
MDSKLREVLDGIGENRILPFLWMHGEDEGIIREELNRIHGAGIGAVCVESRPHPDFAGPTWWRDMDVVLDEAQRLGMRVWILDDSHFPTGYANGWIKKRYPEKGKLYLVEKHVDACGPLADASFIIDGWMNQKTSSTGDEARLPGDELVAVIAYRRDPSKSSEDGLLVDITAAVREGTLRWDIPAGLWRIFILSTTRRGGGRPDYINPIDHDSVRVLIDAVYEPHYAQYRDAFGTTIAGFFSDEPEFGNTIGYNFDESIGRKMMPLPWCGELPELLEKSIGRDYKALLPCLWFDLGDKADAVRFHYMDAVSRLYKKNFSEQLGDWCRERGVEYIGHIIEDQNAHARLGCGPGHFFRAQAGQDMSGVDVVNQQIVPGFDSVEHSRHNTSIDGEFFHYALAKLGSSSAHIDPRKKGRAFCELYGAFGWVEGLKMMKWLTDHMLVRGINWLVPHAFSPKEYPDPDCPPHLYARGKNPQYRYLGSLMRYANRLCHLLSDGHHVAPVAILYHAEAEWSGDYMLLQKPARLLAQSQIDYDILPSDLFSDMDAYNVCLDGAALRVNGETYRCLVIPYSQRITRGVARFIEKAAECGFEVVFLDRAPEGICGENDAQTIDQHLLNRRNIEVIAANDLIPFLQERRIPEIGLSSVQPHLRYYHYRRAGNDLFMFFNEHPYNAIAVEVKIPISGAVHVYDALANTIRSTLCESGSEARIELNLSPYESRILFFGEVPEGYLSPSPACVDAAHAEALPIEGDWRVSKATAVEYPTFGEEIKVAQLADMSAPGYWPAFSGTIRYETVFAIEDGPSSAELDLGAAFETAEVFVNGQAAGIRICPPYRFDVSCLIKPGANSLRIEVTTTLARERRDKFSKCMPLEPSGLMGPVVLRYGASV